MKKSIGLNTVVMAFTVASIVYSIRTRRPAGRFLKVPYDFRVPTFRRVRERLWNPEDPRIFTPTVFGVGWALNLCQLAALRGERLGKGRRADEPQ
jgi:uncharacterized membrane protein